MKAHKSCLGDVEEVHRPKIVRDEGTLLEDMKERIFAKHVDKLKKEMCYRNSSIQRTISEYDSAQKEFNGTLESSAALNEQTEANTIG